MLSAVGLTAFPVMIKVDTRINAALAFSVTNEVV